MRGDARAAVDGLAVEPLLVVASFDAIYGYLGVVIGKVYYCYHVIAAPCQHIAIAGVEKLYWSTLGQRWLLMMQGYQRAHGVKHLVVDTLPFYFCIGKIVQCVRIANLLSVIDEWHAVEREF